MYIGNNDHDHYHHYPVFVYLPSHTFYSLQFFLSLFYRELHVYLKKYSHRDCLELISNETWTIWCLCYNENIISSDNSTEYSADYSPDYSSDFGLDCSSDYSSD